jgi:hypothetical protein
MLYGATEILTNFSIFYSATLEAYIKLKQEKRKQKKKRE